MTAIVQRFQFEVLGETLSEVTEKLDQLEFSVQTEEGGEPWVVTNDQYEKRVLDVQSLINGDPSSAIYFGTRQVMFVGPNKFGEAKPDRDGFRPQKSET